MSQRGGVPLGLVAIFAIFILVIGAFSLALNEGLLAAPVKTPGESLFPTLPPPTLSPQPAATQPPVATPSAGAAAANTVTASRTPVKAKTSSPIFTATISLTPPPAPTTCPQPAGWSVYLLQAGDTLAGLAARYGAAVDQLAKANCLVSSYLLPGTLLYLPPVSPTFGAAYPTSMYAPCGAPSGWVRYTVRPNDTLSSIGVRVGVSIAQLQSANCLGGSTLIRAGDQLFVPFIPAPPAWTATSLPPPTLPPPTPAPTWPPTLSPTQPPAPTLTAAPPTQPPASPTPAGPTSTPYLPTVEEPEPTPEESDSSPTPFN